MSGKVALLACLAMCNSLAAQDARAVLQGALKAMGGDVKSIQYSGTGMVAAVGQNFGDAISDRLDDDWPRFDVTRYTRVIDFVAKTSREEMTRIQGNNRPRGGGGQPLQGERRDVFVLNGNYAWDVSGTNVVPQPGPYLSGLPVAEFRQLDIWLTPFGFIKAALAANPSPTAISITMPNPRTGEITMNGKETLISFTHMGKYHVVGTFNDKNELELVETWIGNPVFGNLPYELRYTEYKDFGGFKYPTLLHIHHGDPSVNLAHNSMEIRVTSAQKNVEAAIPVPEAARTAVAPPVRAESRQLADGVWFIGGGTHNSVAVSFRDFVTVIEAPLNEERSLAVMAEVARLAPDKPIRYVVNTHHHWDHSGGLRTYLAHGATIVTHVANRNYYERVLFSPSPRTLLPDQLSTYYPYFLAGRTPLPMEVVREKYVISDGVRVLEVHALQGPPYVGDTPVVHAATMLFAYLPKEKFLVNADLYSPGIPGAPPLTTNPNTRSLLANIERLKLDVALHTPIHGQPTPGEQFKKLAER